MREYTDLQLETLNWAHLILNENIRQLEKWGIQTHSLFEWSTYTIEELGSCAKAISEFEYRGGDKNEVIKEAVQVATLCLKIAEMVKGSTKI